MEVLILRSKSICFLVNFLTIFSLNSSYANTPLVIHCPAQIETKQELMVSLENKNWHLFKPYSYNNLSQIELYSGLPEDLAVLKPDVQNNQKAVWYFDGQHRYSLSCYYNHTSIQLTKILPKNLTQCTLIYKKYSQNGLGADIPDYISCQ